MIWQETPYSIVLLAGSFISVLSALITWRHTRVVGARWASFLLLICSEWMLTYALEMASPGLAAKVFWNKLEYIGAVTVPTTFLIFALRYTDRGKWINHRVLLIIAIEPIAALSLAFTNELHHLTWSSQQLENLGSFTILVNGFGIAFWGHSVYAYTALALATVLLVETLVRSGNIYGGQASSLLFAVLVPWVSNALYITHWNPFSPLDLTPFACTLASIAIAWTVSGLRISDISSASRRMTIESMGDGVIVLDIDDCIIDINPAATKMLGLTGAKLTDMPIRRLWPDWTDQRYSSANDFDHLDRELRWRSDGREITCDLRISPVKDWRGRLVSRVIVMRDITERRKLEDRYAGARYLADHDPVTGLLNHRGIHERLELELQKARREGQQLSVVMMDIEGFKLFNDTYGHSVGDQVLCKVAELLANSTRPGDLFGRYGGDEFVAILPNTDIKSAIEITEDLRSELAERPYVGGNGNRVPIRLSYGLATYPNNGQQTHELMGYADVNLYESKQMGGSTIFAGETDEEAGKIGTFGVLEGLVMAVDRKDRYTRKHSEEVTKYSMAIANALGLSQESLRTLRIAGLLHDIGKIGVPDHLLRKPGRLDDEEEAVVRQHVTLGEIIIKDVPNHTDVAAAVATHHERIDGLGYPRRLKGEDIPLLGRILAAADAYSAMTTDRVYRQAMTPEMARAELLNMAGIQLDRKVVEVFVKLIDDPEYLDAAAYLGGSQRSCE